MSPAELKDHLDALVEKYNRPEFIEEDPISIPHQYSEKSDIEIVGLLAATIAWGKRKTIVANAQRMASWMGDSPTDFVLHAPNHIIENSHFKHRTFNEIDLAYFIMSLRQVYTNHDSLEDLFLLKDDEVDAFEAITRFRTSFTAHMAPGRTNKHLANPAKGAASKRIHMFLRWMVRDDNAGVDFGLWKNIPMSHLSCPLDVHTGNVARALGLLSRKANDRKAVEELNRSLRLLDPLDPVKYDFALFGFGVDKNN